MAGRVNAGCTEPDCGWSGSALTGWLPWRLAERMLSPELLTDPKRRKERGGAIFVRARLRLLRCPKCGSEGTLTRAAPAAEAARLLRQAERQVRTIGSGGPTKPTAR